MAHQLAFELYYGKPAANLVCHHCDRPNCINPAHLYDGTKADNGRDYAERGPSPYTAALRERRRTGNHS